MAETTPKPGPKRPQKSKKKSRRPATAKARGTPSSSSPPSPTAPPSPPPATSPAGKASRPRRTANRLGWAALIIALLALAVGGYAWRGGVVKARIENRESREQLSRVDAVTQRFDAFLAAQQALDGEVNQLNARLDKAEEDLGGRIEQVRDELRELRELQAAAKTRDDKFLREVQGLSESIAGLRAEFSRGADHWGLAEAEQLLIIANQRLQLANDAKSARKALQLADDRLRRIADPALAPVRELLAGEIVALGGVPAVDVAGTLNALAALSRGVEKLPLAGDVSADAGPDPVASPPDGEAAGDDSGPSSWAWVQNLFTDLGALVQVETDGEPLAPILSGQVRWMMFEKTRLTLESAQLAFLRQQGGAYAERMAQAQTWVTANFDTASAEVGAWLAQLAALTARAAPPETETPDISASLQALREVMRGGN